MLVLDCETLDSAIQSTAAILRLGRAELLEQLPELLEAPPNRLPVPERICWFHATRAFHGTAFHKEGILPLPLAIEKIWSLLGHLALEWYSPQEWRMAREKIEQDPSPIGFRSKIGDVRSYGPFGGLVKPLYLLPNMAGRHDYLRAPEIVADICDKLQFGDLLQRRFQEASRPCLVKFWSDVPDSKALKAALTYIRFTDDPTWGLNTFFNGGGKAIEPTAILDVQWDPEEQPGR
jgi:hypothetical protein